MIVRSCAFILFIMVCCGIRVLSYLLLFLHSQISLIIICMTVSVNFVVCLVY